MKSGLCCWILNQKSIKSLNPFDKKSKCQEAWDALYLHNRRQIRTSQEVDVSIVLDNNTRLAHALQSLQPSELSDIFMTSHVYINQSIEAIKERESTIEGKEWRPTFIYWHDGLGEKCCIKVQKSKLHKCPRCWNYHSMEQDQLCSRCVHVLQ